MSRPKEPPDGPDELLIEIAEMERSVDYERARLDGARSCAGCRELILDDFDHDFCDTPVDDSDPECARLADLVQSFTEDDDPTVPMPVFPDASFVPERLSGYTPCRCRRTLEFQLVKPTRYSPGVDSQVIVGCPCGYVAVVSYEWEEKRLSVAFAQSGTLRS